jgi:hypothetical protein
MSHSAVRAREVTLLDLLDRVIDRGVILAGDVTLSVADVDLVYLGLRVLLAPVERLPDLVPGREARPMQAQPVDAQPIGASLEEWPLDVWQVEV